MSYQTITLAVTDGMAALTLNRPDRLNAFSRQMLEELADAWDKIEKDQAVRAVLLTGAGRAFCAGADLADSAAANTGSVPDTGALLEKFYNPMIRKIRALPKPVISAVNGVAAGAGCSLALCADIAVAGKSASFLQAFARIGLMPDAGGTWFLPRLVGDMRARALALLADQIPADKALAWGMIWQVVEDGELLDKATALAKQLAAGPTQAYARIKAALNAASGNTLSAQLDLERDYQRELGRTGDFAEGVAAFLQKRPAKFAGR
jgi:2-(1,2-epoxy-1,2-dihydrophenyl)acetyl-CoA isomerase